MAGSYATAALNVGAAVGHVIAAATLVTEAGASGRSKQADSSSRSRCS